MCHNVSVENKHQAQSGTSNMSDFSKNAHSKHYITDKSQNISLISLMSLSLIDRMIFHGQKLAHLFLKFPERQIFLRPLQSSDKLHLNKWC